jgi:hypothetical protein
MDSGMIGWVAAAMAAMALGAEGQSPCTAELFRVARSTNANVVLYEARDGGVLDPAHPVHPTWLMLDEDGRREELNGLEWSLAYGVDVQPAPGPDSARVTLKAEPRRPLLIRRRNGCLVAIASIGNREALLRVVYVDVGGGLLPEVRSVELIGADLATGAELRETIVAAP